MRWVDLGEDQPGVTPGISFRTSDYRFRIAANRKSLPESERTWILWDMRGQAKPWGPLEQSVSNPVLLEHGIPTRQQAQEIATLVASLWPLRLALTTRTWVRRAMLRTRMQLLRHLLRVQAKLS